MGTAFATETQHPVQLYQEYEAVVEEVNERHGLNLMLCPFKEIDQQHMGPVQGVQADAKELAKTVQFMDEWQGAKKQEQRPIQKFVCKVFRLNKEERGVGNKLVSVNTEFYASCLGMDWTVSPIVSVNTPTGEPDCYIQDVRNVDMVLVSLPTGYEAVANGSAWYEISPNKKSCTIYQQFTLTKNYLNISIVPKVILQVDSETGVVSVGKQKL